MKNFQIFFYYGRSFKYCVVPWPNLKLNFIFITIINNFIFVLFLLKSRQFKLLFSKFSEVKNQ
jgi:hypothetical protein